MSTSRRLIRARIGGLTLCAVIQAAGCTSHTNSAAAVAFVNGVELTRADIDIETQAEQAQRAAPRPSPAVLQDLVDRELLAQRAEKLKLDRDADVLAALRSARRATLAQSWLDHAVGSVEVPEVDIDRYFSEHLDKFKGRQRYDFTIIDTNASDSQWTEIKKKVDTNATLEQTLGYLQQGQLLVQLKQFSRTSDELSDELDSSMRNMLLGRVLVLGDDAGRRLIRLASRAAEPLGEEHARPIITRYLQSEMREQRMRAAIAELRAHARIVVHPEGWTAGEMPKPGERPRDDDAAIAGGLN